MVPTDRLQRFLVQPDEQAGATKLQTQNSNRKRSASSSTMGSAAASGQILLTNWQVFFKDAPPDPSEFNLVFNNHNLIDDDKLSLLSPPPSPTAREIQPAFSTSELVTPPTPHTVITYVEDRERSPTDYRSPTDSDEQVEIMRLPSAQSASTGFRNRSHTMRSERRLADRPSVGHKKSNSNSLPRGTMSLSTYQPNNICHNNPDTSLHYVTQPQPLEKSRKKRPSTAGKRHSSQPANPKLINYGMI